MKPNLKVAPYVDGPRCKECFYAQEIEFLRQTGPEYGCKKPLYDKDVIDFHCNISVVYIEVPCHAVTVPDSE